MRVLFLCNSAQYGGAEIWVQRAALALRDRGHAVVLASPAGAPLTEAMTAVGVPWVRLDAGGVLNRASALSFLLGWRRNRRRMLDAIDAARGDHGVEVVHVGLTAEKLLMGRASPLPLAWTEHGPLPSILVHSPLFRVYRRAGLAAPAIHCVSRATAAHFRAIGFPPERLRVIRTGIRFEVGCAARAPELRSALGFDEDQVVAGAVGRLVRVKGLETLVEAASRLAPGHPALRFLVVGDGPLRSDLEALARRLGVRDRFVFTGHRPDVADLLQAMDIHVAPSRVEGLPLTILEAMHSGVPTVATAAGGNAELVADGETGFLVPVGDSHALADRVARLAADGTLRASCGRAARRRAAEVFDHEDFVDRLEQFVADAAASPAPARTGGRA